MAFVSYVINLKERMVQLQDAQKEAEVTSEVTERELELEAQLVEARSIIQEQVSSFYSYVYVWNNDPCPDIWHVSWRLWIMTAYSMILHNQQFLSAIGQHNMLYCLTSYDLVTF